MTLKKTAISFLSFSLIFAFTLLSPIVGNTPLQGLLFSNIALATDQATEQETSGEEGMRGISCETRLKIAQKKYKSYECPDSKHEKCERYKKTLDKLNEKCGEKPE